MKSLRLSLKKREILRGYRAFSRVITEGESLQKGAIRCFFASPSGHPGSARVGFSVSRSVRNAVERNRARRWMRETYRRNKHLLVTPSRSNSQPVDVVFLLRVRDQLPRTPGARSAIDEAMIALLKELHQQLLEKP